ncbi:hypothetical protein [Pelovirga terrestris]|uniref:Uncharacterized protein n=1 Tax=Pelovirga terrestris TaxID=2771352 RepID=A0A8J6UHZ2_9BACT|nr:hypothetical protein [Pelovirga terrestris]MBD1400005.1 hypothetical protein [Pelovirga terrestris]
MTRQLSEKLLYQGTEHQLHNEPLSSFLNKNYRKLRLRHMHTGCYRGYIASWEIVEGRLYLMDIVTKEINLEIAREYVAQKYPDRKISRPDCLLNILFPDDQSPVFAGWYTGSLVCPAGKVIGYPSGLHRNYFTHYLHLFVNAGSVESEELLTIDEMKERGISEI